MKKIYLCFVTILFASYSFAQVNFSWADNFGGSATATTKIRTATDAAGNVYVTGVFEGTKTFGTFTLTAQGSTDAFIAKFDATGTCIWARNFGGSGATVGNGVAVDAANNVYVSGTFTSTLFFDTFYYIATGFTDGYVVKFDGASGNSIWCNKVGGTGEDKCEAIALDNNQNIYLIGYFTYKLYLTPSDSIDNGGSAYPDAFIAKYDSSGGFNWVKKINGSNKIGRAHV